MPKKSITQSTFVTIDDKRIPVKYHLENRTNVRASIGKKAIHLRMPIVLPPKERKKHWEWFKTWTTKQFEEVPELMRRFYKEGYKTGDILSIYGRTYKIKVSYHDLKNHKGSLDEETIHLKLNPNDDPINLQKSMRHLISRIVGSHCLPEFTNRVDYWNDSFFKETINQIRFKYNQSNWGSCSANRNLNFSTRLLFAPLEVIDYVIIHELAHLKELNHSPSFWNLVKQVMPDYKLHEAWLETNGNQCDF